MKKKVVILGGGNGLSTLLRGIKNFPVDITAIVTVSDDGKSTGKLREEFNIPAVGDIRRVLVSLAETEPLVEELFNYRFQTTSELNGHTIGNLLLTAITNIAGNMSDGIESLSKVLNLKGKVLPLTEDNCTLMAEMQDGSIIEGEHNITESDGIIKEVFYKEKPVLTPETMRAIKEADLIVLSMGSLYTSIIPNLIVKEMIDQIDASDAKIMYVCNIMTQPGETDNFKVSDHINTLNKYLGKRKVDTVIVNNGNITQEIIEKYSVLEQKDPVILDKENIDKSVKIIECDLVDTSSGVIKHDILKLGFNIFSCIL